MRLGPYEILALLGAGGMGEVYRARDTRLGREVAVKVLPASFTADAERVRRFELEARTTGMLNHPNILAVYDIGTHEGAAYLVTELLEGATLRDQLPVPRRKALEYARQIALGLAAAHAKGVTHRDLKPENLFITTDGRVKILDFGLAKVMVTGADAETLSAATTPGVALGTVGYMSPEQVRGTPADSRSDIFSLGVILYEMLSGQRTFHGASAVETMNAILKEDPPPLSDPALDRLVRQCLEKNPEERFQSARDLSFNLETLAGSAPASGLATVPVTSSPRRPWLALALLAVAIGVSADLWIRMHPASSPQFTGVQLGGSTIAYGPRLSPDGRTLAFQSIVDGQSQVAVMNPGSGNWTVLSRDRTRGSVINISWSPDSSKVYYDRFEDVPRGVFSIPALGGEERLVLEDAAMPELLPDGSILAGRTNAQGDLQLHRFTPQTGRAEPLNALLSGAILDLYRPFPDGKEVAYLGRPTEANATGKAEAPPHLYALDLASGRSRPLAPGMDIHLELGVAQPVAISSDGNSVLTCAKAGDVYHVISIPRSGRGPINHLLTLTGPPFFLDAGADGSLYADQWARPFDVLRFAASGGIPERLASSKDTISAPYSPVALNDGRFLLMAQFAGKRRLLVAAPGRDGTPFVENDEETSPPLMLLGEREVAFQVGVRNKSIIAIAALPEGRIVRRLQETQGPDLTSLAASPDGKTIYYSREGRIWTISATGGSPRQLTSGDSIAADPNGRDIVVQRVEKDGIRLFRFSLDSAAERAIPLTGGLKLFPFPLSPNAVRADGRILLSAFSVDSWFQSLAVLNPATGRLERLPAPYSGDIFAPGWTKDGRILAAGFPMRSSIWRFQKEKEKD